MKVSSELLARAMQSSSAKADAWVDHLNEATAKFDINSLDRTAGFFGMVRNETGSLTATKEVSYYNTPYEYCVSVFGQRMPSREIWESWRAQGPAAFYNLHFDHLYSDILWPWLGLGNTQPGDGSKYVGRGVGLTGRYLHEKYGRIVGVDLVNHPELLEQPKWAALTIAAMWKDVGNNERLDRGDAYGAFKKLNPGGNGSFFDPHMKGYRHIHRTLLMAVQTALLAAGYDPKGLDGIMGTNTRAAWEGFRQARGLSDKAVLPALGF